MEDGRTWIIKTNRRIFPPNSSLIFLICVAQVLGMHRSAGRAPAEHRWCSTSRQAPRPSTAAKHRGQALRPSTAAKHRGGRTPWRHLISRSVVLASAAAAAEFSSDVTISSVPSLISLYRLVLCSLKQTELPEVPKIKMCILPYNSVPPSPSLHPSSLPFLLFFSLRSWSLPQNSTWCIFSQR